MLQEGSIARLSGLQSQPLLNGVTVKVVKYQSLKQRYVVTFPGGERGRATFKPENLLPLNSTVPARVEVSIGASIDLTEDLPRVDASVGASIDLTEDSPQPLPSFCQLRDHVTEPERPWAISFREMIEPAESVTHVLLSSFGHARSQLDELRRRLEATCPRLEEVLLVSDWRNTDGVGASRDGPVGASEGFANNPHYVACPAASEDGTTAFRVRCAVLYPPLAGDEPERAPAKA